MRRFFLFLSVVCTTPLFSFSLTHHRQLILVIADDWHSSRAKLWRFEKQQNSSSWAAIHNPIYVQLGTKGLAWGRGIHPQKKLSGPIKRESDARSPAGIFPIGPIIGFRHKQDIPHFKMPYIHLSSSIVAVDDSCSPFYNQIVDTKYVESEWSSSMNLAEYTFLRWGALIEYNSHPATPREGSCNFLCLNNEDFRKHAMTSTSMEESNLLAILNWLRQSNNPIIVQLPFEEYKKYQKSWQLPEIEWNK